MGRTKEKRKIIHQPTTHEIFICLAYSPVYSKILLDSKPDKPYVEFLRWLLQVNFNIEKEERISIKKLAQDCKTDAAKVTKWIKEIYNDIFELNGEKPELFQKEGIKLTLFMSHHDSSCTFLTTMPVVPREFESLRFHFVKGITGLEYFYVKKVEHEIIENIPEISIWLEAGFINKYRELALDKAKFQGRIGFWEFYDKHSFELDDILKKIYRD